MTVTITGRTLTLDELIRVARDGDVVRLDPAARKEMTRTRAVVEEVLAAGTPAYGVTTAVGALKRVALAGPDADRYARRMIGHHRVAQGPPAPDDVVRATLLLQLNAFASGTPGVRPLLAERLVEALAGDEVPAVRSLGSVGQADLAPLADLAGAVFEGVDLAAGEGLALITGNAFATAWAALAVADLERLLGTLDVAAALGLEGLAANLSVLHPAVEATRPHPGLALSLATLRRLLAGSGAWEPGGSRELQDPLSFRTVAHVHGAARDALAHARSVLDVELNASQGNPIVVPDDGAVVSVANFEIVGLAAALDYQRIVLATVLGGAAERVVKLLERPWSGLPTGLAASGDADDAGLAYLGIAVQALAAEARLLAAPVSFELVSTAHAEGIEDRTTMAPLAARRTDEMVGLGRRIAAIELVVAAQGVELRGTGRLGAGTAAALRAVRRTIPFTGPADSVPDVEPLVDAVARGEIGPGRLSEGQEPVKGPIVGR
jgi:histidine ammonia-lyase